jgi:glutaredoxin
VPDAGATAGPGGPAAAGAGTSGPLPAAGDRVVIYLTQACPHCRRAKEWMTRAGIPFVERDVERDGSAARWLLDHTGTTAVPVFQVGSRVLQGFNPDALRKAVRDELGIQLL